VQLLGDLNVGGPMVYRCLEARVEEDFPSPLAYPQVNIPFDRPSSLN
jgi:hypothetical protein